MSPAERQDLWFLFFAYTGIFIVMFGFLYRMLAKTRHLEREVELLRGEYGVDQDALNAADQLSPGDRSQGIDL